MKMSWLLQTTFEVVCKGMADLGLLCICDYPTDDEQRRRPEKGTQRKMRKRTEQQIYIRNAGKRLKDDMKMESPDEA